MLRSPSLAVISGWPPLCLLEVKHFISSKSANIRGKGIFLQWIRACRETRGDIPTGEVLLDLALGSRSSTVYGKTEPKCFLLLTPKLLPAAST